MIPYRIESAHFVVLMNSATKQGIEILPVRVLPLFLLLSSSLLLLILVPTLKPGFAVEGLKG